MHELVEHGESKSQMFRSVASIVYEAMGADFDIGLSEPTMSTTSSNHDVSDSSSTAGMASACAVVPSAADEGVVFLGVESVHGELVAQLDVLIRVSTAATEPLHEFVFGPSSVSFMENTSSIVD